MTMNVVAIALAAWSLFLALVALGLTGYYYRLVERGAGTAQLRAGDRAPAIHAASLDSDRPQRFRVADGLVLFVSTKCGMCKQLVSDVSANLANPSLQAAGLKLLCTGDQVSCRALFQRIDLQGIDVLVDLDGSCREDFGIEKYPSAVVVEQGNVVRYAEPQTFNELEMLLRRGGSHEAAG